MAEAPLLRDVVEEPGLDASIQHPDNVQAATEEIAEEKNETSLKPEDDGTASSNAREQPAASKEGKEEVSQYYQTIHKSALNGDWKSAERFLIQNPGFDITQRVNRGGMTVLHVAANMGHAVFMTKLVGSRFFRKEALRLQDNVGFTPLHYAASVGSLSAVNLLVSQDDTLTQIPEIDGAVPLFFATSNVACKAVVWYLTKKTTNDGPSTPFSGIAGAHLIFSLVAIGFYDICLYLFNRYPHLAADSVNYWQADITYDLLLNLAYRPSEFPSGSKLILWERCIYHLYPTGTKKLPLKSNSDPLWAKVPGFIKRIGEEKYKHQCIVELLKVACEVVSKWEVNDIMSYLEERNTHLEAAGRGVTEIIRACFEYFPHYMDDSLVEIKILVCAIENRRENVYNIMMERGISVKFLPPYIDEKTQENALHLTAQLAPYTRLSSVSCLALQMQRELQWFKTVENFVRPPLKVAMNKDGKTPREVFTTKHKGLVRDAESWLKDTASSCLVVATLIITVVFAAAFTFPGGNIDGIGIPLFLRQTDFLVFAIFDAIGMFSSATSILMFLSILMARYAEDDFLCEIPKRLIFGLVSLVIALASMMVTFGVALYIALHPRFNWVIFPIIGVTSIPVGLFYMMQLPFIIFMIRSTYGPGVLKNKIMSVK